MQIPHHDNLQIRLHAKEALQQPGRGAIEP